MEIGLFLAAAFFFCLGFPASALLVRVALSASRRFSPRAALALSGVAALSGALAALTARGGLRQVPAPARDRMIPAAFAGGTLGRSLLLMFTAHSTGSLPLLRLQAAPLLLLCLLSLLPQGAAPRGRRREHGNAADGWEGQHAGDWDGKRSWVGDYGDARPPKASRFTPTAFFCGVVDGFFGAGGALLLSGLWPQRIVRRRFSSPSLPLLLTVCAQGGALLLTACAGASQVFPGRMIAALALGAALGALAGEYQKQRGPLAKHASAALKAYLLLCALSGVEQAITG